MRYLLLFTLSVLLLSCGETNEALLMDAEGSDNRPLIVFVTGDEEYRSEESMPMLAKLAERELGARTRVLYAVDSAGYVNPNVNDNIPGLEVLDSADMMVAFLRWRALPADQAKYITDFAESGKPMVGFRTSTHTFKYPEGDSLERLNNDWPTAIWGQQWIVHHGHFDDGHDPLTQVMLTTAPPANQEILDGVEPFPAYSWLYHVDGGEWALNKNTQVLLKGKSLRSKQEAAGKLDQYPIENPVAWTNNYNGARVFFTTLGHPYDWKNENMRRLALNGMAWAMEREIPDGGHDATLIGTYEPNNSGFGDKFKAGLRPGEFTAR